MVRERAQVLVIFHAAVDGLLQFGRERFRFLLPLLRRRRCILRGTLPTDTFARGGVVVESGPLLAISFAWAEGQSRKMSRKRGWGGGGGGRAYKCVRVSGASSHSSIPSVNSIPTCSHHPLTTLTGIASNSSLSIRSGVRPVSSRIKSNKSRSSL